MLGQRTARRVWVASVALALGLPAGAAAAQGDDAPGTGGARADATWAVPAPPTQLVVDTEGAAPVVSKDDYLDATLQLAGTSYDVEIKGRGNSTWKWPKKPYKVKFSEPAGLLGMPAHDEWVLLANYADRSALRNHLAFQLGRRTRLPWTPDTRFVDVVLNGEPAGLYLLTEQVEQGVGRVELPEGGYLLEVDQRFRASGDPGFRTRRRTPISFKDPDELERKQRRQVKKAMNEFEDVLYGPEFADPVRGYAPRVDVVSFVDWYVLAELFHNQDSNFYSSVNVTWTPGGLVAMGPPWDYDQSAGTRWEGAIPPQGWHTRLGRHWIARMMEDPAFSRQVKERFLELRPLVDEMVAQVPAAARVVQPAAEADWARWHTTGAARPGAVHADSFAGEVEFLRRWLAERIEWVVAPEVAFDRASGPVPEVAQVVDVPVRLLAGSGPATVEYAVAGGSATAGQDYEVTAGTLEFAAGETVRTFPVRILDDDLPEGQEKLHLALRASTGARLGDPERLTLLLGASDQRPDAQVRSGGGRYAGVGVHDAAGRGQTVRLRVARGGSRSLAVRVANAHDVPGTYRLQGRVEGRGVAVRWLRGGDDVTKKVRSTRGLKVRVRAGGATRLRAVVRVRPGARAGRSATVLLSAVWRGRPVAVDTVRAKVRVGR
ncbi:CotH kinase family protein [Nocardioides solisilvae]|uniref:CotH kinase family protein n=1 Tax=Nocardioides solisilvae TaxID=1542435 RepID=UPI000D746EC5|nr:CotH kinase family protein [Nocardioides solisilvae]